jgi:hypothetical protein
MILVLSGENARKVIIALCFWNFNSCPVEVSQTLIVVSVTTDATIDPSGENIDQVIGLSKVSKTTLFMPFLIL